MILSGTRSSFHTSSIIDSFNKKNSGDIIASEEWNHLGDSIFGIETSLSEFLTLEREGNLNPETRIWTFNTTVEWIYTDPNHLSVTGMIILPEEASTVLGTARPLAIQNLVKVQIVMDNSSTFQNITSAVYCPENIDPNPGTLSRDWYLTLIIGLYFDGNLPPANINTLGITANILIMSQV